MSLTADEIARVCAAGRAYVGTPCLFQGRSKQGIDCIGIPESAYIDAGPFASGFVTPTPPNYTARDIARCMRVVLRWMRPLTQSESPMAADVAVYDYMGFVHAALLVDGNPLNAIHASSVGRVVETRFDPARGKIRGVFRWR